MYFLHGPEPYFIDYISDYIANNVLSESERGFNQQILYGKDTDANALLNACSRYPLMSTLQVIILKEAQQMKGLTDLEKYFENPVPTTILVICHKYKSLDKRLKIAKPLEKNAVMFESKPIAEAKVPEWIEKEVSNNGFKISQRAAHLITEYVGSDMEKISNIIGKLTASLDKTHTIDVKDIEGNVAISREYNAFELINAMAVKDMTKITKVVNFLAGSSKENPFPVIIAMMYGFFSKITAVYVSNKYDKESMKALGIMEWNQKEYSRAAQTYGPKLRNIMQMLLEYDLRFKGVNDTGTGEAELLREMVYKIVLA